MSVPTWRRDLSSCEYLYQIFQLNKTLGHIYAKTPTKYRGSYGDHMIKAGLRCLELAQIANRTYVTDEATYQVRKQALTQLLGEVEHISTTAYIFLELVRFQDNMKPGKLYEWENEIGDKCGQIIKMVNAVSRKTVLKK